MTESRIRRFAKLFHPAYFVAGAINATLIGVTVYGVHQRYQLAELASRSHENDATEACPARAATPSPASPVHVSSASVKAWVAPTVAAVLLPPAASPTTPARPPAQQSHGPCTEVDLRPYVNVIGILQPRTSTAQPLDPLGISLSAAEFRTPIEWSGYRFDPLASNTGPNVIACDGQEIPVPSQGCAAIAFLGMAVDKSQENQVFTIRYAGGTSSTHTQTVNTWRTSRDFADDTVAKLMTECVAADGHTVPRYLRLYAYRFECQPGKTASSLILPRNRGVIVLAVAALPIETTQNARKQLAATPGLHR